MLTQIILIIKIKIIKNSLTHVCFQNEVYVHKTHLQNDIANSIFE